MRLDLIQVIKNKQIMNRKRQDKKVDDCGKCHKRFAVVAQ